MMGVYDDKVEEIQAEAQLEPSDLTLLSQAMSHLEHRWQDFDESFTAETQQEQSQLSTQNEQESRLQYPTTPKEFNPFDNLRTLRYTGPMLTAEERF